MKLFRVNEAARELGCSEVWLRRAERNGKIPQAKRDLNNWRVYTLEDIARLKILLIPRDSISGDTEDAVRHKGNN